MDTVNQIAQHTPEEIQQKQLLARKLGLDLNLLQQFAQNPNAFKQQYTKQFNDQTNTFTIDGITPGGLIGAPQGPNGTVLAAGSTPKNPLDLAGVKSSAVQPNATFLPPYLQPGANATQGNNVPAPGAVAPVTPPASPPATSSTAPSRLARPNAGMLGVPYYLRGAKRKTVGNNMVAYG